MIPNLFSIFDPCTRNNLSLNWFRLILPFIFIPIKFWILNSRYQTFWNLFLKFLNSEFKILTKKNFTRNLLIFNRLIFIILFFNFLGLFPYIFTPSRHVSINLSLSLFIWIRFIIYGWIINTKKIFIHLVPINTPFILINFIVLIETIRNIIRPWTLTIRLTANILAGHLLLSLLGSTIRKFLTWIPFTILIQNLLFILEISVSLIQIYVFIILLTLYFNESNYENIFSPFSYSYSKSMTFNYFNKYYKFIY